MRIPNVQWRWLQSRYILDLIAQLLRRPRWLVPIIEWRRLNRRHALLLDIATCRQRLLNHAGLLRIPGVIWRWLDRSHLDRWSNLLWLTGNQWRRLNRTDWLSVGLLVERTQIRSLGRSGTGKVPPVLFGRCRKDHSAWGQLDGKRYG